MSVTAGVRKPFSELNLNLEAIIIQKYFCWDPIWWP